MNTSKLQRLAAVGIFLTLAITTVSLAEEISLREYREQIQVNAELVRPLVIKPPYQHMNFGTLIKRWAAGMAENVTVTLRPVPSLCESSNSTNVLVLRPGDCQEAIFLVKGPAGAFINLTLGDAAPGSVTLRIPGGQGSASEMTLYPDRIIAQEAPAGSADPGDASGENRWNGTGFFMPDSEHVWVKVGGALVVEPEDLHGKYQGTLWATVWHS